MDKELQTAKSHIHLALLVMQHRKARLENTRSKTSRHYSRAKHTKAMLGLIEELLGFMHDDPDNWDDAPDPLPF